MSGRTWIIVGALLAALAVLAGAFGVHGLKQQVKAGTRTADQLATFETAVRYQMFHAIALILVGLASRANGISPCTRIAAVAFLLGIVLFCGWLYANVLWGNVALPFIVPIGGTAFVVGWVALAVAAWHWPAAR